MMLSKNRLSLHSKPVIVLCSVSVLLKGIKVCVYLLLLTTLSPFYCDCIPHTVVVGAVLNVGGGS